MRTNLTTSVLLSFLILGCGGSDSTHKSDKTIKGVFYDDIVENLRYVTNYTSKYTNDKGEFEYNGGKISFYVGNVLLGTLDNITPDGKVFLTDLYGLKRGASEDSRVIKIARLLQSLNENEKQNKIFLNKNFINEHFKEHNSIQNIDLQSKLSSIGKNLVSEEKAKNHLLATFKTHEIKYDKKEDLQIIREVKLPEKTYLEKRASFEITGEHFPETLAMSLEDAKDCNIISKSSTKAVVSCVPTSLGTKQIYVAKKPGGEAIRSEAKLEVEVVLDTRNIDLSSNYYLDNNIFYTSGYAPCDIYSDKSKCSLEDKSAKGNCTWYASGRLQELGFLSTKVNKLRGNATTWSSVAKKENFTLSSEPSVGAVAQAKAEFKGCNTCNEYSEWGHVAIVEKIIDEDTIQISESSYAPGTTNWDFKFRYREVNKKEFSSYISFEKVPKIIIPQTFDVKASQDFDIKVKLDKTGILGNDDYTLSLQIGDGGGGFLTPHDKGKFKQIGDSFVYTMSVTKVMDNRKYKVLLYKNNILVSSSVGTYNVKNQETKTQKIKDVFVLKVHDTYGSYDLMWEDNEHSKNTPISWGDAMSYCHSLNLGGFKDWYMPKSHELRRLLPSKAKLKYLNPQAWYWTSEEIGEKAIDMIFEDFAHGKAGTYSPSPKSNLNFVRCVRSAKK